MKKVCVIAVAVVLLLALGGWGWRQFFGHEELPGPGGQPSRSGAAAAKPREPTLADFRLTPALRPLTPALVTATKVCRTGLVIDLTNRETLWEKNADQSVEIASMTKMMTAYLLMRAIHVDKRVTLGDVVPVSRTAAETGGSQVWLAEGERFSVEELARCMMIKSANDTAQLLAEYLGGGSADTFVAAMNNQARQLGLTHMQFYNPHGLPPDPRRKRPENEGTARELAFLASRLLEYPDVLRWASTHEDKLIHQKGKNPVTQFTNHNGLIGVCPGVNGMKTGYTTKSQYCTTVTCTRDSRTMIVVVTGCPRGRPYGAVRDRLVRQLLDWAYAQNPGQPPAARSPRSTTALRKSAPVTGG